MTHLTNRPATEDSFLGKFHSHPARVGGSYFGHMCFAAWFSAKLLQAAGAALIHAVIPPWCETTASQIINELHDICHDLSGGH